MPLIIDSMSMPYDSGQSNTARPEPVDVTIAPAKTRKSVDAATSLVKRRNQTGVASRIGTAIRTDCISSPVESVAPASPPELDWARASLDSLVPSFSPTLQSLLSG